MNVIQAYKANENIRTNICNKDKACIKGAGIIDADFNLVIAEYESKRDYLY